MSYSFEFVARDKHAAHEEVQRKLDQGICPREVFDQIATAVMNIDERPDHVIHVKADGHLCNGRGSYEVTTCTLVVKPLRLVLRIAPATEAPPQAD